MAQDSEWRKPTESESLILKRMLQAEFAGVNQLREQALSLLVKVIDEDGSLSLKVQTDVRAAVADRIPVEASYPDSEAYQSLGQAQVHILLHVLNGAMHELEIYKDDGTKILRLPTVSELHIFTPSNWDNE